MFSQPSSYIPHRLKFKDINEANPTKANDHGAKKISRTEKKTDIAQKMHLTARTTIKETKHKIVKYTRILNT